MKKAMQGETFVWLFSCINKDIDKESIHEKDIDGTDLYFPIRHGIGRLRFADANYGRIRRSRRTYWEPHVHKD